MIESHYYKKDLLLFADNFRKRELRQIWREDSLAKAEKQMFIGLLFVRKMIESLTVTTQSKKLSVSVLRKKINPKHKITDFNRHKVLDYINDSGWDESKISVDQICDKAIHSWVNYPIGDDKGGLFGFILTTDKYKNCELFQIPLSSIIKIFEIFGNSYPEEVYLKRDSEGNIKHLECK